MKPTALANSLVAERNATLVTFATAQGYIFPNEELWENGIIVVSKDQVMQSAAGYYIGQACYEYLEDELFQGEWSGPMPYARDTEYMSHIDAVALLTKQRELHPASVMPFSADS